MFGSALAFHQGGFEAAVILPTSSDRRRDIPIAAALAAAKGVRY